MYIDNIEVEEKQAQENLSAVNCKSKYEAFINTDDYQELIACYDPVNIAAFATYDRPNPVRHNEMCKLITN